MIGKLIYINGNICAGKNFISDKLHYYFHYPVISVDNLYNDINDKINNDNIINRVIENRIISEFIYVDTVVINTSSRHKIRYNYNAINILIYCDESIREKRYIKRYGSLNGYITRNYRSDFTYNNDIWDEDTFLNKMKGIIQ